MSQFDRITRRRLLASGAQATAGPLLSSQVGRSTLATQADERMTAEVVGVSDGDTVDVQFEDGSTGTIRVLGIDTPEKARFDQFERPEEWEGLAYDYDWDQLDRLNFDSACSLYADDGTPLTDESTIVVHAETSATTENNDSEDPAVPYDGDTQIPLVAQEGSVVGFGAVLVGDPTLADYERRFGEEFVETLEDVSGEEFDDISGNRGNQIDFDAFEFDGANEIDEFENDNVTPGEFGYVEDQEEFLINIWNDIVGEGTVLWDESHGQYYTLDRVQRFTEYAAHHNFEVESAGNLTTALEQRGREDDADALVIVSPESGFTAAEFEAIRSFVDEGGALFLHDQSDFRSYDQTSGLNVIARELDLPFRWNDDQVLDDRRNDGADFVPWTEEFNTEQFGRYFRKITGIDGGKTSRTTPHLEEWADRSTEFARERLAGETVDIAFDAEQARRDQFGRLLTYIYYDATGDGSRDTLYNRELVETGHARMYSSGFDRFHEFQELERQAREESRGVWESADVDSAPSFRNRPVKEVFFPEPVTLRARTLAENQPVPEESVVVHAHESATRSGGSVDYDELPLVAVDPDARVAAVAANVIEEQYEHTEEFPVDIDTYENFVLVTNLVEAFSERDGAVHIDGGHGQFGASHGSSAEDAAYYQRYLEGQQIRFEQVTDITGGHLDGRGLIVTGPAETDDFSSAELAALSEFRDSGGAIILLGANNRAAVGNLNAILSELGSDLRFSATPVTDPDHSRNDNPALVETTQLNRDFDGLFGEYDGTASIPDSAQLTVTESESDFTDQNGATGNSSDGNETGPSENGTNDSNSSDGGGPGFTLPSALAGLGGASYLLKRRLTGESDDTQ